MFLEHAIRVHCFHILLRELTADRLQVKESEMMSERDRLDKQEDFDKFQKRFERLKSYRDQNKQVRAEIFK